MNRLLWLFRLDGRIWSASILNALFLFFQLRKIIQTKSAEGVSIIMFSGFVYMQITYMQLGYKTKQWGLFWGMLASVIISILIISFSLYF